ncbi:hypothetical protein DW060_00985 [Leyella stercorea]|uniref:Uncharacterized protein n=1 Tax=Leyella stercorea TaxID=363265 RepID=A0A3R6IWQ7_9BACT|nr:hypothetical protein DW060_00985 [Leyella stercorea]
MFVKHKISIFAKYIHQVNHNGMTTAIISIATALLLFGVLYLGGWEWIGEKVAQLLPKAPLTAGEKVVIFLNGEYNRTATITKVGAEYLYIYGGSVKLPVDYRGRFYGYGVDTNDGSRIVFLKYRKHYRLVRLAEYIRKCFCVIEDEDNLVPDCMDNTTDKEESEVSDEC